MGRSRVPRRTALPRLAAAAGCALVLTGIVLFLVGGASAGGFGWFAYAPLSDGGPVFAPGITLVRPIQWWGVVAVGLGACLISGALGYALGRRR